MHKSSGSPFIAKDLGRSLYCCFWLFAILFNPLAYLPVSAYFRLSLEILILGLAVYPLLKKSQPNFLIDPFRKMTFQTYALLICGLSITAVIFFKILQF